MQDLHTPGTGYNPGSFENIKWAGQTPYPGKAGYITPGGPGYMTPDGLSYGGGPPGYMTPGTPQYGIDDIRREHSNEMVTVSSVITTISPHSNRKSSSLHLACYLKYV